MHAVSEAHQRRLAEDASADVRGIIAKATPYGAIFDDLLNDPDPVVRGWCAGNPRIFLEQMEQLVSDRARATRAMAASHGLRYPTDEQLIRLARDKSAGVRWSVIFRVDTPREALQILVDDTDEMNRLHADLALNGIGVNSTSVIEAVRAERAAAVYVPFE